VKITDPADPGFVMDVLGSEQCDELERPAHLAYRVIDRTGDEYWVCSHEVEVVEA